MLCSVQILSFRATMAFIQFKIVKGSVTRTTKTRLRFRRIKRSIYWTVNIIFVCRYILSRSYKRSKIFGVGFVGQRSSAFHGSQVEKVLRFDAVDAVWVFEEGMITWTSDWEVVHSLSSTHDPIGHQFVWCIRRRGGTLAAREVE